MAEETLPIIPKKSPDTPRRKSRAGVGGRPPKNFQDLGPDYQTALIKKIADQVEPILATFPADHVDGWKIKYWNAPSHHECIIQNLTDSFNSLPVRSPIRTVFINEFFSGVDRQGVADTLAMTPQNVSAARGRTPRPLVYYLRNLGFNRNRNPHQQFVLQWIAIFCLTPSGRWKLYFFGTLVGMYLSYYNWCTTNNHPRVHFSTFKLIKDRERIGLMKGDKFISDINIKITNLENDIQKNQPLPEDSPLTAQLHTLQVQLTELKANREWAKTRKAKYRNYHINLENQPWHAVLSIDFFAKQTNMGTKIISFVIVVATMLPLQVPDSLLDHIVIPETPVTTTEYPMEIPEEEEESPTKQHRRTKKEIQESEIPGRVVPQNHVDDKKQKHKKKLLPQVSIQRQDYFKPHCKYFHFVVKKTSENKVKQTFPYVHWALEFLFVQHGVFNGFSEVTIFSDGCGKHFKTYPTHFYLGVLQNELRTKLSKPDFKICYHFLPPGDAHNRADGAAAQISRKCEKIHSEFHHFE
jgi:hypothetical protein